MLWLYLLTYLPFPTLEEPPTAPLNTPFPMKIGEKVDVDGGPEIEFLRLEEDSRCPRGVNCIWAGQATIVLAITSPDGNSNNVTLTGFNVKEKMETTLDGYTIRFQALRPHPKASQPANPADYLATLVVTDSQ